MSSFLSKYWFIPLILLVGLLAALTRANYQFATQNPGGNDFLVHWVGTRALLVDGISPYSDEVALRIQTMAYGRPARSGEHELRVAYPLYSAIVFTPFALIGDYTLARAIWMTTLEVSLVALAFLSLNLTGWKPGLWVLTILLLFSLTWYHAVRPLINGNAVILVTLGIAATFAAMRAGRDELAGVVLALTTIKPQVAVLAVAFVWIWTLAARRWKVALWTVITLVFLSVVVGLFVPDWPLQNLREVLRYPGYNPPGTPGAALATWWPALGPKLGWGLTALLGILLVVEWAAARRRNFRWFLWAGCLTLAAGQWIGIQTDPGNFIVLFLPLVLVFAMWEERWGIFGRLLAVASLVILLVSLWALFLGTIDYGDQPQQHLIMFFPLPFFVLVGLYWVRWWVIRPARLPFETLLSHEEL